MRPLHVLTADDVTRVLLRGMPRRAREAGIVVAASQRGFLPALLVALHLQLPLAEAQGWVRGRQLEAGQRLTSHGWPPGSDGASATPTSPEGRPGLALVVEGIVRDAVDAQGLRQRLATLAPPGAPPMLVGLYAGPGARPLLDAWLAPLPPGPAVFTWDLLHDPVLAGCIATVEGLLVDDDAVFDQPGALPPPLVLPSEEIGCLLSTAPAAARPTLTAWLDRHGIRYRELLLHEEAAPSVDVAAWKAALLRDRAAPLLIDGRRDHAVAIAADASRPVLCWQTQHVVSPGASGQPPWTDRLRQFAVAVLPPVGRSGNDTPAVRARR